MGAEERPDAGTRPRPATEGSMRAVVRHRYGPPDILAVSEVELPVPRRGEVVVRVAAASLHPGDSFVLAGRPYILRLAFGLRRPRSSVPGTDLAGTVAAVGEDVAHLRAGDVVFGSTTTGALSEYARVAADHVVPVPASVPLTHAAAVPTSGMTALQALRDVAHVQAGQTVLVTGASGGVGSFAVQIAKALGAEVTGVCSTRNVDLVRSLGADHVVDYTTTDFTRARARYDVILDSVEAQPLAAVRGVLAPSGTLIPNSGRGGRWLGPIGRIIRTRLLSLSTRQRLRPFTSIGNRNDLLTLSGMLASGQVAPVIDRTYSLDDAADAFRHVAAGHSRGKVVITF